MSKKEQLFDIEEDWERNWIGMPGYDQKDLKPWQTIIVHFANMEDRERFSELVGQRISHRTRSIYYPKAEIGRFIDKRWVTNATVNPRYPVYIPSKGRWKSRRTVKALEAMGVPFHVVVEPQEYDEYASVIEPKKILTLPRENYGEGCSIPARNWIWRHSKKRGAERHWIIDDNIEGFFRLNNNLKVPVESGSMFRAAEDFSDRYENVAISGFNYFMFAARKTRPRPYTLNTRIYSCILINNSIPYEWRGRYNEDTDLSLRALRDGWCTILFNVFLAFKNTTMTMQGGNTESLYTGVKDGRLRMAKSLKKQHPGLVKIAWKWGRWQHSVDYSGFKQQLKLRPDVEIQKAENNYGMELKILQEKRAKAAVKRK